MVRLELLGFQAGASLRMRCQGMPDGTITFSHGICDLDMPLEEVEKLEGYGAAFRANAEARPKVQKPLEVLDTSTVGRAATSLPEPSGEMISHWEATRGDDKILPAWKLNRAISLGEIQSVEKDGKKFYLASDLKRVAEK
jgi:hypothetical protein